MLTTLIEGNRARIFSYGPTVYLSQRHIETSIESP